jgi:hypothetical protein
MMEYVSAEWVHDPVLNEYTIKATGDDDSVWWLSDPKSSVPPWPAFLEGGGTITGTPPPEAKPA